MDPNSKGSHVTTISHRAEAPYRLEVDVLVLFAAAGRPSPRLLGSVPEKVAEALRGSLEALRFGARKDEVSWLAGVTGIRAPLVAIVGTGGDPRSEEAPSGEALRRAAGAAARALAGRGHAAVVLPADDVATLEVVAEGIQLGAYSFTDHRGGARGQGHGFAQSYATTSGQSHAAPPPSALAGPMPPDDSSSPAVDASADQLARLAPVTQVDLVGGPRPTEATAQRLRRAAVVGKRVAWARDLVNTSPNVLYPYSFGERCRAIAPGPVEVTLLDEASLRELGCGGILGVGQGSKRPPMVARLRYHPENAKAHLSFVGKGITFDSGGLCLKPAASMVDMKCDMAGAAAVAAAVFAIADLRLPIVVDGWLALAENMTGSNAQRPGDVVTMADGSTCEIINTDAEGRLVLADTLVLASKEDPDAIIDLATLTGAAVVALGKRTAAVMANDDDFQGELTSAATQAGEAVWPMPITPEMRKGLESLVADRKHSGSREGGAMLAAAFLREFVGTTEDGPIPWGHLDIAGPAYNTDGAYGYTPKGGTGFGVRTLLCLAESRA